MDENGRLRHFCHLQLLISALKHDVRDTETDNLIRLLEQSPSLTTLLIQRFTHSDILGALTGKNTCYHLVILMKVCKNTIFATFMAQIQKKTRMFAAQFLTVMKKVVFLVAICALALCGCKETATDFAGKYSGVFSTTRTEENFSLDTAATVTFTVPAGGQDELLMQSCFPVKRVDTGNKNEPVCYVFDEENALTEEMLEAIYQLCGFNQHYFFGKTLTKVGIKVRFYSATAAIEMRFSNEDGFVGHATFTGSK